MFFVAAVGFVAAAVSSRRGSSPGPSAELAAAAERQRQQMEEVQRQLEQERREKEELFRQLRIEEEERMKENERFRNELTQIQRDSDADRAHHIRELNSMNTQALRKRLLQTRQHLHDLQNELTRVTNIHSCLQENEKIKAAQVYDEKRKIAHFECERNDESIKKLVVLGMTGDGKSTLCNRLCGDKSEFGEDGPFVVSARIDSETIFVCKKIHQLGSMRISVVDTPGIADSESRDREHVNNVIAYLRGSNGVNQFLVVKNIANPRFSIHYREMLQQFEHFLGEAFWGFVTVVLTHCDGHNKRKFGVVKQEVIAELREHHAFTRHREVPVIGVGIDDYEAVLVNLAVNIVPTHKYTCEYLTSPIEELAAELHELKVGVSQAGEDVERVKQNIKLLRQKEKDVEDALENQR